MTSASAAGAKHKALGAQINVAVLGAGGAIAPAVIRDLAESDEVATLRLLDVDERRAAAAAREHGGAVRRRERPTPALGWKRSWADATCSSTAPAIA